MKINVDLYGGKGIFGGRETPLEADEIFAIGLINALFTKKESV